MKASLLQAAIGRWKELAALEFKQAEDYAFQACGCEVAYPTWWAREDGSSEQVDCSHLGCRIRRREFRRPAWLVRFTAEFRGELSNWLRFATETPAGRRQIARIYWAMKRRKKFEIMACVWTGVLA